MLRTLVDTRLILLLLVICDPAVSGLDRLSPAWLAADTVAALLSSPIMVGMVMADWKSWSAVIKVDILAPCAFLSA
jgi:hypothetical protein